MPDSTPAGATARVRVRRTDRDSPSDDYVIGEEPLEIRVQSGDESPQQLAITMRTPGNDIELTAGFMWGEGLLRDRDDLMSITTCKDADLSPREQENTVVAHVRAGSPALTRSVQRAFTVSSACGVCGSTQIGDLRDRGCGNVAPSALTPAQLAALPETMRGRQRLFDRTGGVHAAGLFDHRGELTVLREDVGRHNAVDKVIGYAVMHDLLPLSGYALAISGRGGFEIVQKAVAAGISAVVAVSAPTSLAVETAREFGMTLLGFARNDQATVYSPAS